MEVSKNGGTSKSSMFWGTIQQGTHRKPKVQAAPAYPAKAPKATKRVSKRVPDLGVIKHGWEIHRNTHWKWRCVAKKIIELNG